MYDLISSPNTLSQTLLVNKPRVCFAVGAFGVVVDV